MMNAAILAGGKASRLGGIEKGKIRICGKTAIERIAETLSGYNLVVVCRDKKQSWLYSDFALTIDEFKGLGPLAGIHAALKYFEGRTLIVAIDMPLIRRAVADAIYREAERVNADALIPVWKNGNVEPLLACYSFSAIEEIEKSLKKGERKVLAPILRLKNAVFYPIESLKKFDRNLVSFFNINTTEDLKRAVKLCSSIDSGEE
jgi:molybdopterin-guanine dinucleotide biosynthesis protein A